MEYNSTTNNIKKDILENITASFNYIENAYNILKYHLDNEDSLTEKQRNNLYGYGVDSAKLSLVRLSNVKKSLSIVMGV